MSCSVFEWLYYGDFAETYKPHEAHWASIPTPAILNKILSLVWICLEYGLTTPVDIRQLDNYDTSFVYIQRSLSARRLYAPVEISPGYQTTVFTTERNPI